MAQTRMKLNCFDDFWIDFRTGAERRWFAPELLSTPPTTVGYSSLVYDRELKKYRLYYETLTELGNDGPRVIKLMESEDMLHWTQILNDDGGDVIFEGNGGVHGGSILYDIHETDPARRYKFVGMTGMTKDGGNYPVNLAFSADGVHWENHPELVANPFTSDTLNKLYYNPAREEYCLLHRSAFVDRRVYLRTSKDLVTWSEPRVLLHPAGVYNDGHTEMQHYGMTAGWFDGIFYGFLWQYRTSLHDHDFTKMFGVMDAELTYSYDGQEFLYTTNSPLIERPYPPKPGWAMLMPEDMCESVDGQSYYLLVTGSTFIHGTAASDKEMGEELAAHGLSMGEQQIYRIRKDGFCGLEAVIKGTVITKGIELLKDDLTFNLRADCGTVRFGIMDNKGNYLEGFGLEDSIPFHYDNGVEVRPQWKAHQLSEVLGRQVRIVVELKSAILHSISATARPFIRQRQKSFADPQGIFG